MKKYDVEIDDIELGCDGKTHGGGENSSSLNPSGSSALPKSNKTTIAYSTTGSFAQNI